LVARQFIYSDKYAFLVNLLIGTIVGLVIEIYLVKRFGGSPGKLIMKMRIAKVDGSPAGYKEASIRYSILFIISMSAGRLLSFFSMPENEYAAFTSSKPSIAALDAFAPTWYQPMQNVAAVWIWSEFLVLLTNKKRRALHDFIAGTVVVRTAAAKTSQ
jgi:uncharacterized RDD family membrane protein YckC